MNIQDVLTAYVKEAVADIYGATLPGVEFQPTRKDFEGDITVVIFPMLRHVKGKPEEIGRKIGEYLKEHVDEVCEFNVIKGFLNLLIDNTFYLKFFSSIRDDRYFGYRSQSDTDAVMVEFSSPNTNKPLHLGHIRNNLLGYSVSGILKAAGKKVYKTQIINDRGIHICKSMLAWKKWGHGETPEKSGLKGDKLVGNYYVAFDKQYKKEIAALIKDGTAPELAEKEAPIILEAQEMLRRWEAGDREVRDLWKKMNGWVYQGFDTTYKNLGVDFDKLYYESDTYLLGKDVVEDGLKKKVFYRKDDGSVWIDLTDEGLDEKIVLRSDGTAVYMTQDIGTAIQRVTDYPDIGGMVYTVGNEQDYHFKVLFLILKKLGFAWAKNLYHLSYGMVDLPTGRMKSREGTVVDADDLIFDMTQTAAAISRELGKLDDYSESEKQELYRVIGLGALKYYILKVDPKKRILFDPEESVDFQGNTGPFIQYTYARIQSILRKAGTENLHNGTSDFQNLTDLHEKEKELLKQIQLFPETIGLAADNYSPALIANYTYDLVKEFNSFYQQVSILGESDAQKRDFRIQLAGKVGEVIQSAFRLLGIEVPQRM
ncbi:MAG TPA: arginine--tRNA ligase [Eudoraea sp.]|nr:arginine--tRNA ligase [Eudoraea sp.]